MLSSVWGELMYHTLGGYLQCDQSTCSIRKAAAYRLQLCSTWRRISPLHTVKTFTEAESSILELTVVGLYRVWRYVRVSIIHIDNLIRAVHRHTTKLVEAHANRKWNYCVVGSGIIVMTDRH